MTVFLVPDIGEDLFFQPGWPSEAQAGAFKSRMAANPGLRRETALYTPPPPPKVMREHLYLSWNPKTLFSLNVRILGTGLAMKAYPAAKIPFVQASCRPTRWCVKHCYAKTGQMVSDKSQRRSLANMLRLHEFGRKDDRGKPLVSDEAVYIDAGAIVYQCLMYGADNVRICGSGDLMPGLVRLIHAMHDIGERHHFRIYGYTKRADLAAKLRDDPRIHFQFSLDPTTPGLQDVTRRRRAKRNPPFGLEAMEKIARPRGWHYCYATENLASEDPYLMRIRDAGLPVTTVFGAHWGRKATDIEDPFQCPGSHPRLHQYFKTVGTEEWPGPIGKFGGAICQVCRWCILHPAERNVLPWRTPMGSINAFASLETAPPRDIMSDIRENLLEMPAWFSEIRS